jgi:hypothetical protein
MLSKVVKVVFFEIGFSDLFFRQQGQQRQHFFCNNGVVLFVEMLRATSLQIPLVFNVVKVLETHQK